MKRPIEFQLFYVEIDLSEKEIGAIGLVDIMKVAPRNVDRCNQ